jgi:hypothetical protein
MIQNQDILAVGISALAVMDLITTYKRYNSRADLLNVYLSELDNYKIRVKKIEILINMLSKNIGFKMILDINIRILRDKIKFARNLLPSIINDQFEFGLKQNFNIYKYSKYVTDFVNLEVDKVFTFDEFEAFVKKYIVLKKIITKLLSDQPKYFITRYGFRHVDKLFQNVPIFEDIRIIFR